MSEWLFEFVSNSLLFRVTLIVTSILSFSTVLMWCLTVRWLFSRDCFRCDNCRECWYYKRGESHQVEKMIETGWLVLPGSVHYCRNCRPAVISQLNHDWLRPVHLVKELPELPVPDWPGDRKVAANPYASPPPLKEAT